MTKIEMTNEDAIEILENDIEICTIQQEEACDMAIKALESQRWIPVSERLPMCEQEVLICAKRNTNMVITTAFYEDGTMLETESQWNWVDIDWARWDDEEDCGVIPEGWWEYRHYNSDEVYNNLVDDFVVKWMPLPELYKEESNETDN